MTTRVLPREEWDRLSDTELGRALDRLPAKAVSVVVVEADGAIVGCWALMTFAHVEGLWIAPAHRKRGRVLLHLWTALRELARLRGVGSVFTGAVSEDVRAMLAARGASPLPPMFVLPLAPAKESV